MDEAKIAAVRHYLAIHFPSRHIEQREDFDRDAQSFKVHLDGATLLLKVSNAFLSDHGEADIVQLLDRFEAAERLQPLAQTPRGLIVTEGGIKVFERG